MKGRPRDNSATAVCRMNAMQQQLKRVIICYKLTPAPYEKAQTSEEMIYMQAVRSSRQLSTEVLRMSAWFLSSSTRGGTETCESVCVRVAVSNCV